MTALDLPRRRANVAALRAKATTNDERWICDEFGRLFDIILDEQALNAELLAALMAVHAPYKTLTEEALEAGILMEFGPPKPDRGAAQLLVRAAIAKAEVLK